MHPQRVHIVPFRRKRDRVVDPLLANRADRVYLLPAERVSTASCSEIESDLSTAGIALFLLPTVWLHREMKRQKEARLQYLQDQLSEHGEHDEVLPDRPANDEEVPQYLYFHLALNQVERTREYPTNAGLVRDLGISSLPSILTYLVALGVALFQF